MQNQEDSVDNIVKEWLRKYYVMFNNENFNCAMCTEYSEDFLFRGSILVSKLLKQGYSSRKLQTIFRKFYGRHTDLVHKFDTSLSHMLNGMFTKCDIWLVSSYFAWIVTGATCGAGNAHSFRNTRFHSLWGVHDFTHSLYIQIIYYGICQF